MQDLWNSFILNATTMALGTVTKLGIFAFAFALFLLFMMTFGQRVFPSFTKALMDIINLAKPYFTSNHLSEFTLTKTKKIQMKEKYFAWGMVALIILINTFQVELQVALNDWGRRFYNTIPKKDVVNFWLELSNFGYLAFVFILVAVIEFYYLQLFMMRWRQWFSGRLSQEWLNNHAHHKMAKEGVDNPDQRISEDVAKFTSETTSITITIFTALLSLGTFLVILWGLSANFSYKIGSYDLTSIPGYLVWAAVLYAAFGTIITHMIGKRLVNIDYRKEAMEANFRFSLARIREYGEPIALLKGEARETQSILHKITEVMNVTYEAIRIRVQMTWFTAFFGQFSMIIPYILLAPAYFMEGSKLEFGNFQQTSSAFGRVESSLQLIIKMYERFADYRATVNRLTGFRAAINKANTHDGGYMHGNSENITLKNFEASLPNGRILVRAENLTFKKGESVLLTGASGSGKSTIFRALANLWTNGKGEIYTPPNMMFLPQKPYIPVGTLKEALLYPSTEPVFSDEEIKAALKTVKLDQLTTQLDVNQPWHLTLSGGEQQRLQLARAFLQKPEWLLLDEATAALDENNEAGVYSALKEYLPQTTLISIGHRSTLNALHDRKVTLTKDGDWFKAE